MQAKSESAPVAENVESNAIEEQKDSKIDGKELTAREKKFASAYIICGNAKQAAIKAGFPSTTAWKAGINLLHDQRVRDYIAAAIKGEDTNHVMSRAEALRLLSDMARGHITEDVVVMIWDKESKSSIPQVVKKVPSQKDRVSAMELMLKYREYETAGEEPEQSGTSTEQKILYAMKARAAKLDLEEAVKAEEREDAKEPV